MSGEQRFYAIEGLLLLILLLTCSATAAAAAETTPGSQAFLSSLTDAERAWLHDHPVIRVVQDPGWPPVEYINERGEPSGMAEDYLKLIEKRLGLRFVRIRNLDWQEAYARLKRWNIDMTTSVAVTPERTEFWAFTKPYMTIPIVVAAQANVTYISTLHELKGKKVAVVDGYAVNEWIPRDYPGIQLVRVRNAQEGLESLQRGDVFAYIDNLLIIGHYQARMKVTNIKIAGETPYVNAQSMAVRKDWPLFAGILQKALDSISENERNEIYRKWLPIRYEHGFNYTLLWQVLGVFALIVTGLLLWNQKLAREIRNRKKAESALKQSEAQLTASLREKEALLRELFHRINNTMQIIRSMLVLQASSRKSPEIQLFVRGIEQKIMAMALVHQKLYQSQDLSRINLDEYLAELAALLLQSSQVTREKIALSLELEPVSVLIDTAIPCGLIISELLSNVVKHAFPDGSCGTISIKVKRLDAGMIELSFADSGKGGAEGFDFRAQATLGLRAVIALVEEQLKGEIHCDQARGLAYRIRFHDNLYEQRV